MAFMFCRAFRAVFMVRYTPQVRGWETRAIGGGGKMVGCGW